MKRILLLLAVLFAVFPARAQQDTLRILAIGNSFSHDSVEQYLWELFDAEGIPVVIGNLYIGGCTLERHFRNSVGDIPDYRYRKIVDGVRTEYPDYTLDKGLSDEDWDVVTLQQASGVSGLYESYRPYMDGLLHYVKARTRTDVKLYWHQTWAYSADSDHPEFPNYGNDQQKMYKAIMAASRRAVDEGGFYGVIPSGTAIQNGRKTDLGDTFNRDGYHLELTFGRYTAACTWFETLSGRRVVGNPWHPAGVAPDVAYKCQLAAHQACQDPFRSLTPEERAADIVSRLTLEEKASLSMHTSAPVEVLGIKAYNWWNEALHGVARNGVATVFPQPVGMAASFDEPLVYEVFTAVSDEARVKNRLARESGHVGQYQGLTFWTPNINLFRDPRWGRGMETYGEDPYLTGQLGMAVVRGLQGPSDAPVLKAHACAKHFAVHSGPEWSRHSYDAVVSERDLRETYLPAFKDLVTKAGVQEVMTAYNRFRGEPCGASRELIDKILRGEWNYQGLITSDCWALHDFYEPGRHGFSPDPAAAAAAAVKAGVDTECGDVYRSIPEAVERGLLDEKYLDRNLIRLFTARYRLGEMDDVSPWDTLPASIVEGPEHRALARRMAQESLVLLQNRGGILPLKAGARIALVGPNGDDREMQWGNYNPVPTRTTTLYDALKERIPGLRHVRGCGILGAEYKVKGMESSFLPELDVNAVLDQLEDMDIVVFAGGISPRFEGEEMPVDLPGFKGGDRTDIQLPEVQRTLLKALHDAGKKVVLVNFSGSAMGLVPETESCDAILQAWYPGEEGGTAVADVLFGEVCPSGKLPVTFYRSVEDLPDFEDYNAAGHTYRHFSGTPLYPFGYGLSYTSFRYGKARVQNHSLIIPVRNTGKRDAVEVVQLYVRRPDDPAGPSKTLRAFRRVFIPAGKAVKVCLPLEEETFLWWDEARQDMVPLPGRYELLYGGNSAELKRIGYTF